MATVAKNFNTLRRRWVAGEPVTHTDDLAPHAFDDLARRGFIEEPKSERSETSAKKSKF